MLSRRDILSLALLVAMLALCGLIGQSALGMGDASKLRLATLRYEGNWGTRSSAPQHALEQVDLRTSVLVSFDITTVTAQHSAIFRFPLLWMTGDREIGPLSEQAVENLRRHLRFGGTLFADDTSGKPDSPFATSLKRELKRIFPEREMQPLPQDHAVFRSYYSIAKLPGRNAVSNRMEGITIDDRAAVIFCANDLSGSLEDMRPDAWDLGPQAQAGEGQELAARLAVNIVMYALTVNYKLDQVHVSYRLSHPELYPRLSAPAEGPQR